MPRSGITDAERTLLAQIAAHDSWAKTENRSARTANARRGLENKFLEQADGDPKRAEHIRKAYFARLALKSAQARRQRGESDRKAVVQSRLAGLDGSDGDAA